MCDVSIMLGKTLTEIIGMETDSEEIIFVCSDGTRYKMFHEQDCCECVRVVDIIGDVENLLNYQLLMTEEVSNVIEDSVIYDYYDFSHTWTWYKIATVKGYVTVRWLGESNGYYSEDVDFDIIQNN